MPVLSGGFPWSAKKAEQDTWCSLSHSPRFTPLPPVKRAFDIKLLAERPTPLRPQCSPVKTESPIDILWRDAFANRPLRSEERRVGKEC
jgi:hypothetical protein